MVMNPVCLEEIIYDIDLILWENYIKRRFQVLAISNPDFPQTQISIRFPILVQNISPQFKLFD